MALVSADSRIAELLTELHQLIKQTQVRSCSPWLLEGGMRAMSRGAFTGFGHAGTQVTDELAAEENVGCDSRIFCRQAGRRNPLCSMTATMS